MPDTFGGLVSDFVGDLRFADVIEIVLVATFFYLLITGLRTSVPRRASRNALATLALFSAVYVAALAFELYFIEMLIERSFVVFLLAAVVIFQREIRRMVDRLGTLGLTGLVRRPAAAPSIVNTLTEAAARMAESRTGALMAIRGREAWDHHIDGGVPLEGLVSLPLLYSLFNPDTPGHDGAVLIERNRVVRFATHLPLSSNVPEVSQYGGTRHAAGLGLSEVCDAFIIVVSEERGAISIAQGADLIGVDSAAELKHRLEAFWHTHYGETFEGPASRLPIGLLRAFVALSLAVLFWASFAYRPDMVYRSYTVPIELRNLPPTWVLEDPVPVEATLTLTGSERDFSTLDPAQLVVSLDLSSIQAGLNELQVSEATLQTPAHLHLYDARPSVVRVRARQARSVQVPIAVETTGALPDSLQLVALRPSPFVATLLVPEGSDPPASVQTEAIDLTALTGSQTLQTRLVLPDNLRLPPDATGEVEVAVDVRLRSPGLR